MTDLLCKIFVKDHGDTENPAVRRRYGTFAGIVCIILNILLASCKFIVGVLTMSVAMQADAINNFSDAGSSVISLISFKISGKPADRDHPFGHARIEYIASMIVSFLILLIGFELLKSSIEKILEPVKTEFSIISVIVLSVSILVKLWISLFNRKIGKRINSDVMKATAADSLSDMISTAAVLASSLILYFTDLDIDCYVGIAVAIFILFTGAKILNETKNSLLGEAPVDEDVEKIKSVVAEHTEVIGIHDLMVHSYGPGHTIASLHAEVDGDGDMFLLHDVIDNIEKAIFTRHNIQCTIHLDPIAIHDEATMELKAKTEKIISEINDRLTLHDFRTVPGNTHTNLIFDVVVPFENKTPLDELEASIAEAVTTEIGVNYYTVINFDRG